MKKRLIIYFNYNISPQGQFSTINISYSISTLHACPFCRAVRSYLGDKKPSGLF